MSGFKVFIKTRLKHPLKSNLELIYFNDGKKYIDAGSTCTVIITVLYLLLWIPVISHVHFTLLGWAAWLMLPALNRFGLRYFWTKFEVYEGEDEQARAAALLKRQENRKKAGGRKAALAIGAAGLLAAAAAAFAATGYPPFSAGEYDPAPHVTVKLKTARQLYDYAHAYAQEQCPEAQLLGYRLGVEKDGATWCDMVFRDPSPEVLIKNARKMIFISLDTKKDYMWCRYTFDDGTYATSEAIKFVPVPGNYPDFGAEE